MNPDTSSTTESDTIAPLTPAQIKAAARRAARLAAKVAKEIKERNRTFKAAGAAEKRVLIAKDALHLLRLGRLRVDTGGFVEVDVLDDMSPYSAYANGGGLEIPLQHALLSGDVRCKVCALGGLMTSCVAFQNKVVVNDTAELMLDASVKGHDTGVHRYFSPTQLRLIEIAFEQGTGYYTDGRGTEDNTDTPFTDYERQAAAWGRTIWEDNERFIAIMRNIVRNGGMFVVPKVKGAASS